ncbi:MAG: AmmeMemoRadiSam system radical SAM enzyme [Chloroflexi bacterium]|nr:AmmeMemoRadiSam system radical SAM enzyme [Chloroflexota bacterium]
MESDLKLSRREFLIKSSGVVSGLVAAPGILGFLGSGLKGINPKNIHEALYYDRLKGGNIVCNLCPRHCVTREGNRGVCGVRENRRGKYYSLVYGAAGAVHLDPVEKKPLFHFLPGTQVFSVGTAGCNMRCKFCQNWELSQSRPEALSTQDLFPEDAVALAGKSGARSIAGTYNEPIVFYEYIRDIALKARPAGLSTVMISAGYINKEPLKELCKHLDAVKIDLKGITENFYNTMCAGTLKPVLDTLVTIKDSGTWLEIVNLVIPSKNDSEKDIKKMAGFIKKNLGAGVPLHFTRFYPQYKVRNLPPTPASTLIRCREIALAEGLKFVYLGNLPGQSGENTYCPKCGKLLIKRYGMALVQNNVLQGKCRFCGEAIPGVWH